ncbi:MAG: hypothetical protein ACREX6_05550, partial [Casimicrobiaceae bacterium]
MTDWLARRRFGVETGLWLAWAAATAVYLPAVLTAAFLSDGAAILWTVYDWHASNELGRHVVTLFAGRLPTGNNYYRPLPFASFAFDLVAYGAHATGWRVTNLAGHLVAMAAVYGLARRLAGAALASKCSAGVPGGAWPLLATLMFGLCAAGPEVVIWTAGRYDVMATAAVLVSLYALARSATGVDRTAVAGWLAAAVGLFCKESAAVVGPVAALVALHAAWARQPKLAGPFVRSFLRRWLPYVALMLGYMAWREHVFGAMFRVYSSDPVAWHVHLAGVLRSLWGWYGGLVPAAPLRALLAALASLTLVASVLRARADGEATRALGVTLTAAVVAVALVLPHKSAFAATGEDARLFYTASA